MDYRVWWSTRSSVEHFGELVTDEWASEYMMRTGAACGDLVVVDPGNGFNYLFDLAGSLSEEPRSWAPRVVGVWGRSQPGLVSRDRSRMRGFPRPSRKSDDRGHLIACAAGGGYDINLVPMDAALNRGTSAAGARFRGMERRATRPGTLFFVRPTYDNDSDRPCHFEVGVQVGEDLLVESFSNEPHPTGPMSLKVLAQSAALRIDENVVAGCIDLSVSRDATFDRGWRLGPASLTRAERCAVAGVTGHVAESVTELLLDALDWRVLWHFTGPGRHGVDLVFLAPDDSVVAVEVKGTLVAGRVPRLSGRDLAQMSAAWVNKADNPGMAGLGLGSADVLGGIVAINFADLIWRAALTSDFVQLHSITSVEALADLAWLTTR